MFSCEFCEISQNTSFYRTPPVAASITYDNTALTWRKGRWILLSAQTVSWSIVYSMVSLIYLSQKQEFKVFIFLLDETEMAQKNLLFVWKTSNYSRGRSNMKNDMKHAGKNNNITGSFSWGWFMWHRLQWFLWCCFWSPYFFNCSFCGRPCCKTIIICISCWSRWFTSTNTKNLTAFTSPPLPLILGNSLPNSCVTDGCWFSSISHFAMFTKSISDCTIFFDAFSLFIILE